MAYVYRKAAEITLRAQQIYPGIKANPQGAWEMGVKGNGILVAVLDGGLDTTHPDLRGRIKDNFVLEDDVLVNRIVGHLDNSHGTECAGIIAANGGLSGVAPGCEIIGIQIGRDNLVTEENFINALKRAKENNVKVINISYVINGLINSQAVVDEIKDTIAKGILICCGTDMRHGSLMFPASLGLPGMLVVGESNTSNGLYKRSIVHEKVNIYAPGRERTTSINGTYATVGGSSYSTAFVSGTAALVFCARPDLSPVQVAEIIATSGTKIYIPRNAEIDRVLINTKKRLNASNAVKMALAAP